MISDTNKEKIKAVVLTQEEINEAIYEGKKKKYFHEKHKAYWENICGAIDGTVDEFWTGRS